MKIVDIIGAEKLHEEASVYRGGVRLRAWLKRNGQLIELKQGESHGMSIYEKPDVFGMSQTVVDHIFSDDDDEGQPGIRLAYIVMKNGWIRIANDHEDAPSVNAINTKLVQYGVRWMVQHGYVSKAVRVEVEPVYEQYRSILLQGPQIEQFIRFGTINTPAPATTSIRQLTHTARLLYGEG